MEQITQQGYEAIMAQRYLTTKDIQSAFMINRRAASTIKRVAIDSFNGACPLNSHIVLKDSVIKAVEDLKRSKATQHPMGE